MPRLCAGIELLPQLQIAILWGTLICLSIARNGHSEPVRERQSVGWLYRISLALRVSPIKGLGGAP